MKKSALFIVLPLVGLVACSGINTSSNFISQAPENNDLNRILLKDLAEDEILLNLTVNGLYNGERGQSSSDYNLENYVIVNLNVGDTLPTKDTITSTVQDVEFTTWQYATDEGELAFVDTVHEGQKFYQAYFAYLGEGEEDVGVSFGDGMTSIDDLEPRMIYLKNNSGWSSVNIYAWNSYGRQLSSWPGTAMEVFDASNNIYCYELSPIYTSVIFNDGSSQTADLAMYDNVNTYIVSNSGQTVSYGWYENGNITNVELPQAPTSYYFVGTKTNWLFSDQYKLTVDIETDSAYIDIALVAGDTFKIADSDWNPQFDYSTVDIQCEGLIEDTSDSYKNIRCSVAGTYHIVVNGLSNDTQTCTITKL